MHFNASLVVRIENWVEEWWKLQSASRLSRAPEIDEFGAGFLAGGIFTGAARNLARAMGPVIAGLFFPGYWYIYWIGPVIGAILAGLVYRYGLEKV